MTKLTAEVEMNFKNGIKSIQMEFKEPHEIENCEKDKVVMFNLKNGETYHGFFKGMDGEEIMISPLEGKNRIGLNINWVGDFLEEIN